MRYDFEAERVKDFLARSGVKRVAIQLPAGLRPNLAELMEPYEAAGVGAIVLADNCYGACDLADAKAKELRCDALVHYGHADMELQTCMPSLYVEARARLDSLEPIESAVRKLDFERVGLVTTVQFVAHLPGVEGLLRARGLVPVVGEPGPRTRRPGQVLGCDLSCARSIADRVGGFLYVGTGEFHPLGIALATGKRVAVANPIGGGFKLIAPEPREFLDRRKAMVARAAAAERFGIMTSTKPGQARFRLALGLAESFKRAGKEARALVLDEIRHEALEDFELEAFVCVACPRIPLDDPERFREPILTPFEARVALGEASFEPYRLDEIRASDF